MLYCTSSIFALFWNMSLTELPAEVIANFRKYINDAGLCGMDCGVDETGAVYTLEVDGKLHAFIMQIWPSF